MAVFVGTTLGDTCQRQPLSVASSTSTHTSPLSPTSKSPRTIPRQHSSCSKGLCRRSCCWSKTAQSYKPLSSQPVRRPAVCWAGSGQPADAAAPSPSAKPKTLFSPLVPVFRQTKHDSDIRGLAIPALFSLLLDPVMSLIDCAIIGRLGSDSLAATGASISIFSLAGLLVSFLSYVTVPAVAEAATSGDDAEVSRVISTGVWLAVVAGVLVTGFIIAIGPVILGSMKLEAGVVFKAKGYVWARALGSIGHLLVLVGSGSFRGMQVCSVLGHATVSLITH